MKWGWPLNSRKAHVFVDGRSLCGNWLFFGADKQEHCEDLGGEPRKGDCRACWRKAKKLQESVK
jgi:hypothetical protein